MKAEEIEKQLDIMLHGDEISLKEFKANVMNMMEAYHQSRLNVSDEEIKEMFTTTHFHYKDGRSRRVALDKIQGAKKFRDHLLKQ